MDPKPIEANKLHLRVFKGSNHYIWCLIVLGVLGLISYFQHESDVFPSASIDLKLPKAEVLKVGARWADELGYPSKDAIKSSVFAYDDNAKTFLEYELGLNQANRLMKDTIPVWYWSNRFCRPLNLEEFRVCLTPDGRLLSLDHSLENDRALPSIPHAEARQLAVKFLKERAAQSLAQYKPIEDGSVTQHNRVDHYFTWEDTAHNFKGARLRIYTYVSGNTISAYNYYLYIPETWVRKFSELRSYNKALEEVASIFYVSFNLATFFAFVWAFTSGLLRWRFSLALAAFIALIELLESLNSMPSTMHSYTTTMSYNGYVVDSYISAITSAFGQFLQTLILIGAAEALYRLYHPTKIALEKYFSEAGLRCKQLTTGLIAGHGLFGIHLGWIILFYLFGRSFGFWSPLEVSNVEGLSSNFPFFSAMHVGITAAVFEEFTYRVLGMSIFQKLVKNFWLANLLQAAAWAFMHSNYPQEPPYARGLELTAVGFVYGLILRQYGLLPCIISHYVFDTFLGVVPLLMSSLPSLKLSALAAVLPFTVLLAVSCYLIKRRGAFANEELLSNDALPRANPAPVVEEISPAQAYRYEPLTKPKRRLLALAAVVATLIQFGYFFPMVGDNAKLVISRDEALSRGRRYLLEHNIPLTGRTEAVWLDKGIDYQQLQYIFEKGKFAKAYELASKPGSPLIWKVRFFRALDPEEYLVTMDATGRILSFGLTRAEDSPGTRLKQSKAQTMVESYLLGDHPDILPFKFDDVSSKDRKARTDYTFRFNAPRFDVAEAQFKVDVDTIGDVVCNYDQLWQLPDKWLFEQSRQHTLTQVFSYVLAAAALVLLLAALWWAIGVARSGAIHWRPAIMLALAMAPLVIPQVINDLPELYVGYGTDTPLLSYFTVQAVKQILTAVMTVSIVLGLAAFALASFRIISPRTSAAAIFKTALSGTDNNGSGSKDFWLDAMLCGYAAGIGQRALVVLFAGLHAWISPIVTLAPLDSFCSLASVISPTVDCLIDALSRGIQLLLITGITVGLFAKYLKNFRNYILFAIIFSLIQPSTERYLQDYLILVLNNLAVFMLTWFFMVKFARQNLLAYFLAGAISIIAGTLRVLMIHGAVFYGQDIAFLSLALLSPAAYCLMLKLKKPSAMPSENQ